jgi:hypothetical protein
MARTTWAFMAAALFKIRGNAAGKTAKPDFT